MLETPHVVIGATIATKIGNPLLAIPIAFMSHFLFERIPHWNPHLNTEMKKYGKVTTQSKIIIVGDVFLALILGTFIASRALPDTGHFITIMLASFAAVLPDIVEGPYFFLGVKNELVAKWLAFQKSIQVDTTPIPGLLTQVLTILAAFWWIFS